MAQRLRVEKMVWEQEIQQCEIELMAGKEIVEMKKREKKLKEEEEVVKRQAEQLRVKVVEGLPLEFTEAMELTEWVCSAGGPSVTRLARSEIGGACGGDHDLMRQTEALKMVSHSQHRIFQLEEKLKVMQERLDRQEGGWGPSATATAAQGRALVATQEVGA